ncbi:protein BIG GRAIN 1-like B [Abrus precatorius]|uniref:Protein BIG GRAIN 1-like B n=1 Tax=Abrus precatorius TaxID=3816 RepID=A0A8B8JQN9_ABRPR|nr:protein BIG GRAIN 1-like B [Abrus precatorius]
MYNLEKTRTRDDNRFLTPSFSSSLLDQIYRSIDDAEKNTCQTNFYTHTTMPTNKHTTTNANLRPTQTHTNVKTDTKSKHRHFDHDQDVLFFSSTSISSDSSSTGFSSSDTESISRASRFAPKPVRTCSSFRSEKQGNRMFDGLCRSSNTQEENIAVRDGEALIKSKSRALKIYNNLKKVKQPISPGGRVSSFLNSLFANTKKNNRHACEEDERKVKPIRTVSSSSSSSSSSTCSSASSFSRSCLSKTPSSDRLCNGVKRTVRFYPVSVIVGEDSRPCGQKRLCEEKGTGLVKTWKFGKRKEEEEASREFLKDYSHKQKKSNDLVLRRNVNVNCREEVEHDDDDASSCASSDLFELDHLAVFGSSRYSEELPVYETTRVSTNRAIANGLVL